MVRLNIQSEIAVCQSDGTKQRRLLLKAKEVCELLGGIHPRTLSRLEKAGHIRSVKLLRHKLFAPEDVNALVESLRKWNATGREATK